MYKKLLETFFESLTTVLSYIIIAKNYYKNETFSNCYSLLYNSLYLYKKIMNNISNLTYYP